MNTWVCQYVPGNQGPVCQVYVDGFVRWSGPVLPEGCGWLIPSALSDSFVLKSKVEYPKGRQTKWIALTAGQRSCRSDQTIPAPSPVSNYSNLRCSTRPPTISFFQGWYRRWWHRRSREQSIHKCDNSQSSGELTRHRPPSHRVASPPNWTEHSL
jgi:hypothetical protein